MAKISSHRSLIAERYGMSLFDLAQESNEVDVVSSQLKDLQNLLEESSDFRTLIASPAIRFQEQIVAMDAIIEQAGFVGSDGSNLVGRFLKVLTRNGRLKSLLDIITIYQKELFKSRKESFAKVIVAKSLTPAQEQEVKALLEEASKHKIHLNIKIDPSILGGMIVRLGAYEIDASLLNKLSSLRLTLKEVS